MLSKSIPDKWRWLCHLLISICSGASLVIVLGTHVTAQNAPEKPASRTNAVGPPPASQLGPQPPQPNEAARSSEDKSPRSTTISGPAVVLLPNASQDAKSNKKEWIELLVSWPTASVIIVILLLSNRSFMLLVRQLLSRVTKVSGPVGIAIELTPEAAKEIRASFAETLDEFIRKADEEYSRAV
jgi:hypothetical protein